MLFATWAQGLPFILSALGALALFAVMTWGLVRSFAGAGEAGRAGNAVTIGVLVVASFVALWFGMIGFAAVACPPDAYECPF
jgi:hypothetical protein